jgi:hypothetical protein
MNLLAQEQRKVEEQGRQIVAAKRQDQAQTNNHHHFVPPSPQKDPAAQLTKLEDLPHFYTEPISATDLRFISGDGRTSADLVFPAVDFTDLGVLTADDYPELTVAGTSTEELAAYKTTRVVTGDMSDEAGLTQITTYYGLSRKRIIYNGSFGDYFSMPLGNGLALIVRYREATQSSEITSHYYVHQDYLWQRYVVIPGPPSVTTIESERNDTLLEQTFSAEGESSSSQEDWGAVLVGYKVAQVVPVPTTVKNAILAIVNEKVSQSREPYDTYSLTCSYRGTLFVEDGNYDEYCIDWPGFYGHQNNGDPPFYRPSMPVVLTANSTIPIEPRIAANLSNASYGLALNDGLSSTPAIWFYLDSVESAKQMSSAYTHESVRSVTLAGGAALSDLFKPQALLGFTAETFDAKILGKAQARSWRGASPTGSVSALPSINAPQWKDTHQIKAGQAQLPTADLRRHFIYDWGRRDFCRSQAARYSISF